MRWILLVFLLSPSDVVGGQGVVIAPLALVAESRNPVASLTVINPTNDRIEVELSAFFGYPATDSSGMLHLHTSIDSGRMEPDASGWITFFPRRFLLEAGDRRLVRLRIAPPATYQLAAGEYWSRIVVASRAAAPTAGRSMVNPEVRIALGVEVRSVLPLLFRVGPVGTGLVIDSVASHMSGDSLAVIPHLRRTGNSAWAGTITVVVRDAAGREVRRMETPLGVYYRLAPLMTIPMAGLGPGKYGLSLEAVTRRTDLPAEAVLQAPAVSRQLVLEWKSQ